MPRPAAVATVRAGRRRSGRVAAAITITGGALLLAGCSGATPAAAPATPDALSGRASASSAPYSPPTPRATDALTLSQAVAAMLHERRVPVDGLDCSPTGSSGAVTTVRCVVTTGADDPDQVATVRWHRAEGTVEVVALDAAP